MTQENKNLSTTPTNAIVQEVVENVPPTVSNIIYIQFGYLYDMIWYDMIWYDMTQGASDESPVVKQEVNVAVSI